MTCSRRAVETALEELQRLARLQPPTDPEGPVRRRWGGEPLRSPFGALIHTQRGGVRRGLCRAGARVPGLSPTPTPNNSHVSPLPLARLNETAEQIKGHAALGLPQRVFDAWVESTGKTTQTKFDAKRKRLAVARLKEFPVEDLLDAARGWKHSPHHRGENSTGTVYNSFELIYRDPAHVEMFRDLERAAQDDGTDDFVAKMNARGGLK